MFRFWLLVAAGTLLSGTVKADEAALIARLAPKISPKVIQEAVTAMKCAQNHGIGRTASRLAIIDYSIPSRLPRLWVVDLKQQKLLFEEYVAHGQGSGNDVPNAFSDRDGSHQTSLGLFLTDTTYQGGNGKQYVVAVAGGGDGAFKIPQRPVTGNATVVAFALP